MPPTELPHRTKRAPPAKAPRKPKPKPKQNLTTMLIIQGAVNRWLANHAKPEGSDNIVGHHWRPSVNAFLTSGKAASAGTKKPRTSRCNGLAAQAHHGLGALPNEIRHHIEDYLPLVDAVCLRQTCQKLRHEAKDAARVQDLNAVQLYTLRTRLDRDGYLFLRLLSKHGKLSTHLALCGFCMTVHEKTKFTTQQIRAATNRRLCIAASTKQLVTGGYSTEPTVLRRALHDVLSTGRHGYRNHHWMPARDERDKFPVLLAAAIEEDNRADRRQSTLFVDDSGLVLEHHFRLKWQQTMVSHAWNLASVRPTTPASENNSGRPICPHHTVYSAGLTLGRRNTAPDELGGSCTEESCGTRFGWCACQTEFTRRRGMCLRVERRFGWMEKVG